MIPITVVGCGVSGLSCGVRLIEAGFTVTIMARLVPPNTTSDKAAALWYPYRAFPEDKVLPWCKATLETFLRLSRVAASGVSFIALHHVFDHVEPDPWWKSAVTDFRRLDYADLPRGYVDGYAVEVPLIETPIYMPYLVNHFIPRGGRIERRDNDFTSLTELSKTASLIVNCTGLGARTLCNDQQVFPLRGQVVRTANPGITRGIADETGPLSLAYIIPRSQDCVLGGTAECSDGEEADAGVSEDILYRCQGLDSKISGVAVIDAKVGLRPGRNEVRLEVDHSTANCPIIHNYGHGGAGFTLSWGCADSVVEIVRGLAASSTDETARVSTLCRT
jgi:D-amino-acid oxidase